MSDDKQRRLYLVRHGEARPKGEDPDRPLTPAGAADVGRMAAWAAAAGMRVDEIRHSGKLRAQQTAEILAEQLGASARAITGLGPEDDVANLTAAVASETRAVMLVGHLPQLERLAASLIAGNAESSVLLLDAGALLELTQVDDGWRVTCLMQPRLLPVA